MNKKLLPLLAVMASLNFAGAALAENHAVKIFTADIAEKALGAPVEPNARNAQDDIAMGKTWVSKALYDAKGAAAGSHASILIRHAATPEETKTAFEQSKAAFNGQDVAGLGDAAYRTKMPAQLNVRKGTNWMIITVGSFKEQNLQGQEAVAKAVLEKITD